MTGRVFHLALADAWAEAFATGQYRTSTLGHELAEVGFIHLSYEHQVQAVADSFYRGRADVVLLAIDPAKTGAEIIDEPAPGTGELFPHLYGALPVGAVVAAHSVGLLPDGRLNLAPLFTPLE